MRRTHRQIRKVERDRSPVLGGSILSLLGVLSETGLNRSRYVKIIQGILALAAALFGLVTIIVGSRVLAGSNPGYIVFRPLLIYNTAMGIAYMAAGVIAWRNLDRGKYAAGTIFVLNLLVLGATGYLYATGSAIAIESVRAMMFRTVSWLVLYLGMVWMSHRNHPSEFKRDAQHFSPPETS